MSRSYRFGDFRLDPATRELWRGDAPVAVPPRAFDCIVYLLEHRERAVGRDELIAAVWGRTETGDGALGQTVLAARRALDDTGKEQHVIRTVFRFGYHWVAAVDVFEETRDASSVEALPAPASLTETRMVDADTTHAPTPTLSSREPDDARTRKNAWLLAVAALITIAAVAAGWLYRSGSTRGPLAPGAQAHGAIALILPVTVTAGAGFDWVRLGLMDLIGSRLRAANLPVVPSDNVVALTGRGDGAAPAIDPSALARATGATLVIEPRAENIGGRWRVTLRTLAGRDPPLVALGESGDVLAAARIAADQMARQLGYAPAPDRGSNPDQPPSANLSQQIEAAMLSDRLDAARALIASASADQREQPEMRLRLAQIDYQAGDFDAAEAGFNSVAEAAPAEQDPVLHARALSNLGVIAAVRDNVPLAIRRFDDAIALLRREHAPDALGKALNGRANVTAIGNQYDAALRDFAEARVAFESTGNLLALAVLDSNLAAMDAHRYRYAEAEPVFERAADRFATFGVNAAELNALTGAAEIKLSLLEPDAALAMDPRLRELIAKVSDPARKRNGELTRAEVFIANGRLQDASSSLDRVIDDARKADDRAALVRGHMLAARLAMTRGDAHKAAAEADDALQRFTAADDARERARTFRLRIQALIAGGDTVGAGATLRAFDEFAEHDRGPPVVFYRHLAEADTAAAAGDAAAGSRYADALAEADALRIPLDLREVAGAYTAWLVRTGDVAKAGATAERVAGWAARDFDSALVQLRVQRAVGDPELWRAAMVRAKAVAGERGVPHELAGPAAP